MSYVEPDDAQEIWKFSTHTMPNDDIETHIDVTHDDARTHIDTTYDDVGTCTDVIHDDTRMRADATHPMPETAINMYVYTRLNTHIVLTSSSAIKWIYVDIIKNQHMHNNNSGH